MFYAGLLGASVLSLAGSALAHGGVVSFSNAGTLYQGWQPFLSAAGQVTAGRPYSSYNPILNPVDPTLSCNDDGTPGPSQQTITVAAGTVITDYYTQWTHLPGPYTVYLAACPASGCSSVNTNTGGLKWFKIYELGLISGTVYDGQWANGLLEAALNWNTTIPSNLLPGDYFIRWETLAIHQANTPQFYPECAQLHITGTGTAFPPPDYLVSIPGAWTATDPGVNIDIYSNAAQTETTYLIPGPRVWSGFAGYAPPPNLPGGSSSPTSTTSLRSISPPPYTSTTSKPGVTNSCSICSLKPTSTSTTASPTGTLVAKYGQCGGTGYTGSTNCAPPATCSAVSPPYYYQCL